MSKNNSCPDCGHLTDVDKMQAICDYCQHTQLAEHCEDCEETPESYYFYYSCKCNGTGNIDSKQKEKTLHILQTEIDRTKSGEYDYKFQKEYNSDEIKRLHKYQIPIDTIALHFRLGDYKSYYWVEWGLYKSLQSLIDESIKALTQIDMLGKEPSPVGYVLDEDFKKALNIARDFLDKIEKEKIK